MKDTLRTRLEFLWAKLAGRDVDIDTLTPDAPTNMVEKLMLETADRITGAEQSGGGGGSNVVIVDLSELPVEHAVDTIDASTGNVVTFENLYLFDVDSNKYYIFKIAEGMDPDSPTLYFSQAASLTFSTAACEDTSDEQWVEGKTFSDTVNVTSMSAFNGDDGVNLEFTPTSTQFQTYKKADRSQ